MGAARLTRGWPNEDSRVLPEISRPLLEFQAMILLSIFQSWRRTRFLRQKSRTMNRILVCRGGHYPEERSAGELRQFRL